MLVGGILVGVSFAWVLVSGLAFSSGVACASCHAMKPYVAAAGASAHAPTGCIECHRDDGVLAPMTGGVRVTRMIVGTLSNAAPDAYDVGAAGCIRCHETVLTDTIASRGISVRHADFLGTPCGQCHEGTGHALEERVYKSPEMDDCLACHAAGLSDLGGCDLCHVDDSSSRVADARSAWGVTHGSAWESTHGMGDLTTCISCHSRDACAKCHGVQMPHPAQWKRGHGSGLTASTREACVTCHEQDWCVECHGGVEMPHPSGFIATHDESVTTHGHQTCLQCHGFLGCEACHVAGRHRAVPGLSPHGETDE
ncbi:MAG: hypothetical protein ACYC77_01980 [Coriobacteriia bacterium]